MIAKLRPTVIILAAMACVLAGSVRVLADFPLYSTARRRPPRCSSRWLGLPVCAWVAFSRSPGKSLPTRPRRRTPPQSCRALIAALRQHDEEE